MTSEIPEGTVTIMFTDVVGSTALMNSEGDEAAQEIMRAQREIVRDRVKLHGGYEVKGTGDGFMVVFQSARRAVECSVEIQRVIEENNLGLLENRRAPVRIGMNSGEVIREDADVFGAAVNAAARVMAKADGGQIFVSETVKSLLGAAKDIQFVDRGRFRLKGFDERWRLFEVAWRKERAAVPALGISEATPFVGREAERAELRQLLERAMTGSGSLVMIGGEAGVGKTRLIRELAQEAEKRGVTVRVGHCYEMEGSPPYIPFIEMIQQAIRAAAPDPQALRAVLAESAPEIARIVPELRRLFPDLPPPLDLPPEQERHYIFTSIREFVQRASSINPLVVVIEDLHWGDDPSLLLLEHFAQHVSDMHVLMLATYRDTELDTWRPLARTMESLIRQRVGRRMSLRPLAESDVGRMLAGISGQEPPNRLVSAVFEETGGNAFFVEEVFQHLSEEGVLFDQSGHWRTDVAFNAMQVPEGLRLVLTRRLERVSEGCRWLLTEAAVIGRAFDFEVLQSLSDLSADEVLDCIDEAERARLIIAVPEGPGARFMFGHELLRHTLLVNLSLPRRQRLHQRIADAIEQTYRNAVEDHASDIAHHLYQAGAAADPDRTVKYLLMAAERAISAAAFEEALRLMDSAISIAAPTGRAEAELLYRRGSALRSIGRWDEGISEWRRALDLYERSGDSGAIVRVCSEIGTQLDWATRFEEAQELGRRGLSALSDEVSREQAVLLAFVGRSLSISGSYLAGRAMLARAEEVANDLGDERLLAHVVTYQAMHHLSYMELSQQYDTAMRASDLLRSSGDLWDLTDALWLGQIATLFMGQLHRAEELGREAEPLAERLGHLGALAFTRRWTGMARFMRSGDLAQFEEMAQADLSICESAEMPWVSHSHSILALAQLWRGDPMGAAKQARKAVDLEPPGLAAGGDLGVAVLCHAFSGDKSTALDMLRKKQGGLSLIVEPWRALGRAGGQMKLLRDFMSIRTLSEEKDSIIATLRRQRGGLPTASTANTFGAWALLQNATEALVVMGEDEEAAKLYPLLLDAIGLGCTIGWWCCGLTERFAGMAAMSGKQWDQAEAHFERAIEQAHSLPHRIEQAQVPHWYAKMLFRRNAPGDSEKASQLLKQSSQLYEGLGMKQYADLMPR